MIAVQLRRRIGEEHLAEHQRGGGAVEEELVPLDYCAGHRGRNDFL